MGRIHNIHEKNANAFCKFISARERHRVAKVAGRAVDKPDAIISKFRFCNVRRNDDRVTKWIHENYLERWRGHKDLWFALVVARLFNNEETLNDILREVLPFNSGKMALTLSKRKAKGKKNFNAAYIVSTNGRAMDKVEYVVRFILEPLWADKARLSKDIHRTEWLEDVHKILMLQNGMASFMAAQVVADLKYADPKRWRDFDTFVASGPGSKRGLNRVMGRPVAQPWREDEFRDELLKLRERINATLTTWEPITAQDIQNCLCEYDKYERVRLGEGVPKQLYKPKE